MKKRWWRRVIRWGPVAWDYAEGAFFYRAERGSHGGSLWKPFLRLWYPPEA